MAVDYSLRHPCEVRRSIPEPKLALMVRHRALADVAQARYLDENPQMRAEDAREQVSVAIVARGADGVARETPVTLARLFDATRELDAWRATCAPCRANVCDRAFGCIGTINYPIAPESEQWLLSRLPADAQAPALSKLFRFVAEVEVDGLPVDKARSRPGLFALRRAQQRHWGEGVSRRSLSSSQLLQMLLFGGDIAPRVAVLYTELLGLETVLSDSHAPSAHIEQLKSFCCAVVMAGRLGGTLGVSS